MRERTYGLRNVLQNKQLSDDAMRQNDMTGIELHGPIVSNFWLAMNIGNPRLVLLDASMKSGSVLGASANDDSSLQPSQTKVFDFEGRICDRENPLPHMMPKPELFEQEVRSLGIKRESIIVVYDRTGVYASPRAWWMFKSMGHDQVAVLDGGMPGWIKAMLLKGPGTGDRIGIGDFVAQPRVGLFCDAGHVAQALEDPDYAVIDVRSEGRFYGREPEPRPGLRSGHMPNSINLPYTTVLRHGRMRPVKELKEIFASKVGGRRKLIFTCGSGVTACILALAAEMAGYPEIAVYDGSWSEWGLPHDWPVVTE